jgi:DNA polymerase-3 subunit epsilon
MNDIDAIKHLEQDDQYRVLHRLNAPDRYSEGSPVTARIGLVIDTEATGLDTTVDSIIELGFVAFEYDASTGLIYRILHTYDGFEDPGKPLEEIIKQITGITDEMLVGKRLDDDEINLWLEKADLIVAHNAAFDRQMVERRLPKTIDTNWACTFNNINWQAENVSSQKLDYLAYRLGFYFDGHRAVNDAQATLHLLTRALPESGKLAMSALLASAREKSFRLFAVLAPFDKKDDLRAHGYFWLPQYQYSDRFGKSKKGVWSRMIVESELEAEQAWLNEHVYDGKEGLFKSKEIAPKDRYSLREFQSEAS